MAARPSLGPGSGVIPGTTFFAEYAPAMKGLFDASCLPLTSVAGTPNDVTANCSWDLDGGTLVSGMKFTITWDSDNTGPMTLSVNSGAPVSVLDQSGSAMITGSVQAGDRSLIEFVSGAFRVLARSSGSSGQTRYRQRFTSSGTWSKPAGLDDNTMVTIQVWGGGGGGGSDSGGGGGGFAELQARIADIPSSVTVTVGAGGAATAPGGTTSFGTLISATGGGGGSNDTGGGGGGFAGGLGGVSTGVSDRPAASAGSLWGGGGGGAAIPYNTPGNAAFGGGGGGGAGAGAGGASIRAGAGGGPAQPGQAPSGGGGTGSSGARGEVIVWI